MGLSIVIPVFNSQPTLQPLIQGIEQVVMSLAQPYEIILVNDGSADDSWQTIAGLAQAHPHVRGINLRRNYGQHNALLCGIRAAQFEIIITMDDDLQHPPKEIPKLLAKLAEGYDLVYGTPPQLPHSFWRNVFSRLTKIILAAATGIPTIRYLDAYRAFQTDLRDAFSHYASPNLQLDVLLTWATTRIGWVPVDHLPRQVGKSNYNFIRLFSQLMLLLTGYSVGPLRFASLLGFVFTFIGLILLLFILGRTLFFGGSVPGFSFLGSAITIFSGAQLFALGIIGEYVARMFNRLVERPTYVIRETTPPQR